MTARSMSIMVWALGLCLALVAGARSVSAAVAAPAQADDGSKWIKHRVVPGERLPDIAARYGVSEAAIRRWNKKRMPNGWIYAGKHLSIKARLLPPPREKTSYIVQFGDSWQKIADSHAVKERDLRLWNKKVPRRFKAGQKLVVWTNPSVEDEVTSDGEAAGGGLPPLPPLPTFSVRTGGLSVGRPNRGRLLSGVKLPDSEMYSKRKPDESYGSTHTVTVVMDTIAKWRRDSGYNGRLEIAALSKRGGGRFRPHRSHQSGRDVDIRLPKRKGAKKGSSNANDIDWRASWFLIKAFVESGQVEYIFLSYNRQRRLHDAAKAAGATPAELKKAIQFPRSSKKNNGVVRHAKGHVVHIHVRIKCAKSNSRCESY